MLHAIKFVLGVAGCLILGSGLLPALLADDRGNRAGWVSRIVSGLALLVSALVL